MDKSSMRGTSKTIETPAIETSPDSRRRLAVSALSYVVPPVLALSLAGIIWEFWVRAAEVPIYIVPPPSEVLKQLFWEFDFFMKEGVVTLFEALVGFGLGAGVALTGAVLMAHSRFLERSLLPLAILVKVTPVVAVAPLFVIWFGFGLAPKILITALITFFPVLVNGVTGFRSVDRGSLDFLRSLNASRREVFLTLRVPSSLPYLFSAFRVSIPLSVIGAVVGEWFSADRGLGSVIIVAHSNLDMVTLFDAIFVLAFMGVGLTVLVSVIERKALFWHESSVVV
ncbi:MAG: ABC transporter permease [SAR202 cluster bacterium]|nr:ABC transporter permease [SAR202 cluster bacterium]